MNTWIDSGLSRAARTGAMLALGLDDLPVPRGDRRRIVEARRVNGMPANGMPVNGTAAPIEGLTGHFPRYPMSYPQPSYPPSSVGQSSMGPSSVAPPSLAPTYEVPPPALPPAGAADGFLAGNISSLSAAPPWDTPGSAIGAWSESAPLESGSLGARSRDSGSTSGSLGSGSLGSGSLGSGSLGSGSLESAHLGSAPLGSAHLGSAPLEPTQLEPTVLRSGAADSPSHRSSDLESPAFGTGAAGPTTPERGAANRHRREPDESHESDLGSTDLDVPGTSTPVLSTPGLGTPGLGTPVDTDRPPARRRSVAVDSSALGSLDSSDLFEALSHRPR